jgi:uncharacterized protein YciI
LTGTQRERRRVELEHFFYCHDKPGTAWLRERWAEAHWSFMDGYADSMIARGLTQTEDGDSQTGSLHIVDLPDADAARVFAYDEPYHKLGVYQSVFVSRWRNMLGRTMWEFEGDAPNSRRFLVIGHGRRGMSGTRDTLQDAHRRYLIERGYQDRLIVGGPLLSDEGQWVGSAMTIELPDRAAVEAMLADMPYARAGLYDSIEVHVWQFGGRP